MPVAGATLSLSSVEVRLLSIHNMSGKKTTKAYSLLHSVDFYTSLRTESKHNLQLLGEPCHHALIPELHAIVNRTLSFIDLSDG